MQSRGPQTSRLLLHPPEARQTHPLAISCHQHPHEFRVIQIARDLPSRWRLVVDCVVSAENKPGSGGVTRLVLLLALLLGGSTDSSSSTSVNSVLVSTVFLLVSPFYTVVLKTLGCSRVYRCASLCFLSLPFLPLTCLPFLPFVTAHGVDFHGCFSHRR